MSTSIISLWVAIIMTVGLVVSLFGLSLLIGLVERYVNKPRVHFLKTSNGTYGFAFGFTWDSAKEPTKFKRVRLRLFNPWGQPSQVEVSKEIEAKDDSFALDLNMGNGYSSFMKAKNFEKGRVTIELESENGVSHTEEMRANKFLAKISTANVSVQDFINKKSLDKDGNSKPPINVPVREFIADTVPGKGAQIALPTNPAFAEYFAANGGGEAGASSGAPAANYAVSKVWIEPGCIVCNACEDIYKDVFEVTADSCIIRPNAPLDDGLRIQEAAEACPVEVIKFTKVS